MAVVVDDFFGGGRAGAAYAGEGRGGKLRSGLPCRYYYFFYYYYFYCYYLHRARRTLRIHRPAGSREGTGDCGGRFSFSIFFFVYLFVLIWLFVLPPVISPFPLSGGSNMAGDGLFGGRWRREELSAAPARPARC